MRFQSLSDIQQLIDQRITESLVLEFKSDAPLEGDSARRKLLRDLTAMGNAGGGTIIFGLAADDSSGVGVAKEVTPMSNPAIVSTMENIVRDAVRPPLLWTPTEFVVGEGRVVVAEVSPSALGPYMIQAYQEHRYFKRGSTGVSEMTEFEISSAYALANRSAEHRDEQWRRHFLPMATPPDEPWLVIAGLPYEPFVPIFEGREIAQWQVIHPPGIGNCLTGLPIYDSTVRHWADGLTADDSTNDRPFSFAMRLHRDGATGIMQKWQDYLDFRATARAINAYLVYLSLFWSEFSLRSPVELDLGICGVSNVQASGTSMGMSWGGIVHPPGVEIAKVGISEEVLPWNLRLAPVRHGIVRRFIERLSYAFDTPHNGELFSFGRLYGRSGVGYQFALGPGQIIRPRPGGQGDGVALIDETGRVRGSSGEIRAFVVGGALIDSAGDTLAVVEMSDSVACPGDYVPDYLVAEGSTVAPPWNVAIADQGGPAVPLPTGKWSNSPIDVTIA